MNKPVIIVGGGGHGAVIANALLCLGRQILGVTDPTLEAGAQWRFNLKVLGNDAIITHFHKQGLELALGVGMLPGQTDRRNIFKKWQTQGYDFADVIHPSSIIGREVEFGQGVQVMLGAVINCGAKLGDNCIINSGAVVEHDVCVGPHSHIAPGAVICGGTRLGENSFVGAGSTVIQYQTIPDNTVIKAGSVYHRNG